MKEKFYFLYPVSNLFYNCNYKLNREHFEGKIWKVIYHKKKKKKTS